ncbi:hypothetical protein [Paraburkholderia hospita]|uniref:hypothetical protein n=1 Tax=Paraburkholderia hospita TaxID=169430 RepID=UPI0013752568|nr:hypothetical protein [Paraburkholderia hospita]
MGHLGMLLPEAFQVGGQPVMKVTRAVVGQFDRARQVFEYNKSNFVYLYAAYAERQ